MTDETQFKHGLSKKVEARRFVIGWPDATDPVCINDDQEYALKNGAVYAVEEAPVLRRIEELEKQLEKAEKVIKDADQLATHSEFCSWLNDFEATADKCTCAVKVLRQYFKDKRGEG